MTWTTQQRDAAIGATLHILTGVLLFGVTYAAVYWLIRGLR